MTDLVAHGGGSLVASTHKQVIGSRDIDIPNIFVVQSNSTAALERDIPPGSLAGAGGAKIFCRPKEVWQFVPLAIRRVWDIYKVVGPDKLEWVEQVAYTADNANAPWEWSSEGSNYLRRQKLHILGMDRKSIEAEANFLSKIEAGELPNLDDFSFPVCLSVKGASMKTAGKALFTHFAKVDNYNLLAPAGKKLPYHCRYFDVTTTLTTKDSNKFFVINMENSEMIEGASLKVLDKWAATIDSSNVTVQDSEPSEAGAETDTSFPAF